MVSSSRYGTFVKEEMIHSKAYRALNSIGKEMLILFLLSQPVHKVNGKWVLNKEVGFSFTYSDAKKKHGISQPRFTRGLDSVIDNGFFELLYQGGGMEGDFSLYRMIENWRDYGTDKFKVLPRPKKGLRIGFVKKNHQNKNNRNPVKTQKMSEEKKIQQQNCCLPGNETVAYVSNDNVAGKPNFANLLSNEIVAILRSPLPWGLYLTNADREQSFGIIKPIAAQGTPQWKDGTVSTARVEKRDKGIYGDSAKPIILGEIDNGNKKRKQEK
jgi:hypothetical protein